MSTRAGRLVGLLFAPLAATSACAQPEPPAAEVLSERFPTVAARVIHRGDEMVARGAVFTLPDDRAAGPLSVELPRDAAEAVRFRLAGADGCAGPATECPGALEIRVREAGARGKVTRAGRALAHGRPGGTSFWTVEPSAAEEWLLLEAEAVQRGAPVASWHVEGATLRQVGNVVLALDEAGTPRLRVTAPAAYASAGERPVAARLSVEGATLALHVDADGEAVLVDPLWEEVSDSMIGGRREHTATLITEGTKAGQVLVVGGYNGAAALNSAELYDPATNTWSRTATMGATGRYQHTATLLGDGRRVLVVGGRSGSVMVGTAQIYDTELNTWTNAGEVGNRASHTATLLDDGDVLVAGGIDGTTVIGDPRRYDAARGTWSTARTMRSARYAHSATRLLDGTVLVVGGYSTSYLATAEIYDPVTNTWSDTGGMITARRFHSATLLPGGDVLVAGGTNETHLSSAERYHTASRGWARAGDMPGARSNHAAVLLASSGDVLVTGGFDGSYLETTARFDPRSGAWSAAESMITARAYHAVTGLDDGRILATGGRNTAAALSSAELYRLESANGAPCLAAGECLSGYCVDGVCCDTACGRGDPGDCQACSVAAGAAVDGVCGPRPSTAVCRPASDVCDAEERCDGTSTACPADAFAPAVTVCRPAAGDCDVAERCTGTAAACPADQLASRTTVCRPSSGPCDAEERCTGTTAACPVDTFLPAITICRPSGGPCDAEEFCTGATAQCPADAFLSATTVCRRAAGPCDADERCTGAAATCPADTFLPATTVCRPPGGPCDAEERCTGTTAVCPADALVAPGTECGPGACAGATTSIPPSLCNEDGACVERAAVDCGLYVCADGACLTRCATHAQCDIGAYCDAPSCRAKKPLGGPCGAAVECAEGVCIGGLCSLDSDADGIVDGADNCPDTPNTTQTDTDGDGNGNACDDDDDDDGKPDAEDACPTIADPGSTSDRACSCAPPRRDGDPCDDGDPCTLTDTCQAGRCVGGDPFVCPQPDPGPCMRMVCAAPNGTCVERSRPEGAPCPGGVCIAGGCALHDPPGGGGAGGGPGEPGGDQGGGEPGSGGAAGGSGGAFAGSGGGGAATGDAGGDATGGGDLPGGAGRGQPRLRGNGCATGGAPGGPAGDAGHGPLWLLAALFLSRLPISWRPSRAGVDRRP
ncbi:kelch repeat-containing protein [Sorangium sp. So ce513]|uniref:kelch repeat-containing protein n=1 Tax=Sorangium sp. So ce513 TaxID=3133315 RepID=UPI003F61E4FC